MKAEQFIKVKDAHFNHLITIKTKLNELLELEKQWEELFEIGFLELGYKFSIEIRGHLFYYTYFYEKFESLINDFHSLLAGQINDPKSFIQNIIPNIKIKNLNDFYTPDSALNIITKHKNDEYIGSEKHKEQIRRRSAEDNYHSYIKNFKEIFCKDDYGTPLCKNDLKRFKDDIKTKKKLLHSSRNASSHKYERSIVEKYSKDLRPELTLLSEVFDSYSNTVNNLSLVIDQSTSIFDVPYDYKENIESIILLIIFDSIEQVNFWNNLIKESNQDYKKEVPRLTDLKYFFQNEDFLKHFINKK